MPSPTPESPPPTPHPRLYWNFGSHSLEPASAPLIMGIVNVTPDSFSDGGKFLAPEVAVEHALQLEQDGADILDIGGESTRPNAVEVSEQEELARIVPVIEQLASRTSLPLSIDTTKAEVARRAIQAGACIVNDISGLTFDPGMVQVCAESDCGVICMHIQGTPRTMQDDPQYEDVVEEIRENLAARINLLVDAGIDRNRIVTDPGIGFGKTAAHNLNILSHVDRFRSLGRPVLIGHSRKRFLGKILNRPIDERTFGTLGVSMALAIQGTDILRVHEVAATRDCLTACSAVLEHCSALAIFGARSAVAERL